MFAIRVARGTIFVPSERTCVAPVIWFLRRVKGLRWSESEEDTGTHTKSIRWRHYWHATHRESSSPAPLELCRRYARGALPPTRRFRSVGVLDVVESSTKADCLQPSLLGWRLST